MAEVLQEACLGIFLPTVTPWVGGPFLFGGGSYLSLSLKNSTFLKEGFCLLIMSNQAILRGAVGFMPMGLSLDHSPDSPLWTSGVGSWGRCWWAGVSGGTRVARFGGHGSWGCQLEKGLLLRPLPQTVRTECSDAPMRWTPGDPACMHHHYPVVCWHWWPPLCPQELTALLLGHKHQGNAGSCLRTACYHLRYRTEKIKQVTPSPGAGRGWWWWLGSQ